MAGRRWFDGVKSRQRLLQGIGPHRDRRRLLQHGAADSLESRLPALAARAQLDMGRDDEPTASVEPTASIGSKRIGGRVMCGGHKGLSRRSRRRFMARRSLDLTVPKGMPKASAISGWGRSSKKERVTTRS